MLFPLALRYIPSEPWEEMNTEENGTALAVFRACTRTRYRIFDYEYKHDGTLWSRRPEPTFTRLMLDQSSLAICQVLPKWRGRCWMPRAQ